MAIKYAVGYSTSKHIPWRYTGTFEDKDQAIAAAKELFRQR